MRRMLLIGALLAGLLVTGTPAHAGTYVFSCGFVFNPPVIDVDEDINILGAGFDPESTVQFFIDGEPLGTVVVSDDVDGNISATFPLPPGFDIDGEYTVTAECPDGNVASNIIIVGAGFVTTTTTTPPDVVVAPAPLPVTGSSSTGDLLRIGGGMLLLGGIMLVLARRRATSVQAGL
jgi:LPXTG-motif cell wall-anchored protein